MTRKDVDWNRIAQEYSEGKGAVQLSSLYNVHSSVIYSHLQKMGIARRPLVQAKRRLPLNERYFQVLSLPEVCYWIGFLFADGNLSQMNNAIRINLKSDDAAHLQTFLTDLGATSHQVRYKIVAGHSVAGISITSKYLCQDLALWGMATPKDERQVPPMPEQFIHHFVRGYFDGDGSIAVNRSKEQPLWKASIVSASHLLLNQIATIILDAGILCSIYNPTNTSLWYLAVGRNQVKKFGQWLYTDASRYMTRKRARFAQISQV